jgi:hypothetical protein
VTCADQGRRKKLLTASELRLHALLEAAVDGLISIDARGICLWPKPGLGPDRVFVGIIQDLAEHQWAEKALRKKQAGA